MHAYVLIYLSIQGCSDIHNKHASEIHFSAILKVIHSQQLPPYLLYKLVCSTLFFFKISDIRIIFPDCFQYLWFCVAPPTKTVKLSVTQGTTNSAVLQTMYASVRSVSIGIAPFLRSFRVFSISQLLPDGDVFKSTA